MQAVTFTESKSYWTVLPEDVVQINHPNWSFGELRMTESVVNLCDERLPLDSYLESIINGNYGMISLDPSDHEKMQSARNAGRRFLAMFKFNDEVIYFAVNELGCTICCLFIER